MTQSRAAKTDTPSIRDGARQSHKSAMMAWMALTALAITGFAPPSIAGGMKDCIELASENIPGQATTRQVFVNTCGWRVYAFWCHVGGGQLPCKAPKHFRQGRYFSPGERYHNSYTLPNGVHIDYGACSGMGTRIKFGANGSYNCPVEGPSLEGKGPTRSRALCDDGRKVDFEWQLKDENEQGAVVRLKDGSVFVPLAEYRAFERKPDGQPPGVLVDRLCKSAPSPGSSPTLLNGMKDWTRQKAGAMENEAREQCARQDNAGDACQRFRNPTSPPRNAGTGVRG
jgi:hypothetical protein